MIKYWVEKVMGEIEDDEIIYVIDYGKDGL